MRLIICMLIFTFNTSAQVNLSQGNNVRDPFKIKIRKKLSNKKARQERFTSYTNKKTTERLSIDRLRVTGIFLGKNRRAVVHELIDNKPSESIIIKEGMKIGPDLVEVKAILPGGVVLVEKIINVYDEEEYLETILPVSD